MTSDKPPAWNRKYDPVTDQQIAQDYGDGLAVRDLMRKYGLGQTAVRLRLIEQGVTIRPRGAAKLYATTPRNRKYDLETDLKIAQDYRDGLTLADLQKKYGLARVGVKTRLIEQGVKMRKQGHRWLKS